MNKKKGLMLVFLTALISGVSIFINKFGVKGMNAYVFTWLKNSVVAVFLLSGFLITRNFPSFKELSRKQWTKLVLIGLFGGSIPFLLFFKGLQLTSAASASFVHKTMFIWVSVLATLLLKQKVSKKFVFPAVLLLVGNFFILNLSSFTFGMGELLILGATVFWSLEQILSKGALKNLDGNIVASGRMFFGSLFILVFLLATGNLSSLGGLNANHFSWVLITSVFLLLYQVTWYNGLKLTSASTATSILLLGSVITTLLNLASGSAMGLSQAFGIVLVVTGVVLVVLLEVPKLFQLQTQDV